MSSRGETKKFKGNVSPGREALRTVLENSQPVILIDEHLEYAMLLKQQEFRSKILCWVLKMSINPKYEKINRSEHHCEEEFESLKWERS